MATIRGGRLAERGRYHRGGQWRGGRCSETVGNISRVHRDSSSENRD
ncbi:MAG UNVERIFIED_CONTAM: hypothetical protein LVR29_12365 [Microcystis novacekii LVE1205-3]